MQHELSKTQSGCIHLIQSLYLFAQPTPRQGPKPNFTRFDIELTPEHITVIKVDNGLGLGLYIDENDDAEKWKVKATSDKTKWNAFRIGNFHRQYPSPLPEYITPRRIFCGCM